MTRRLLIVGLLPFQLSRMQRRQGTTLSNAHQESCPTIQLFALLSTFRFSLSELSYPETRLIQERPIVAFAHGNC
jgi:hypothetical protein